MGGTSSKVKNALGISIPEASEFDYPPVVQPPKEFKFSQQIVFSEGHVYYGGLRGGQRHGLGHEIYENGDCYTGQFSNDQRNGKGVYLFKNGYKFEGTYYMDKRHGPSTITTPDKKTLKVSYHMGEINSDDPI